MAGVAGVTTDPSPADQIRLLLGSLLHPRHFSRGTLLWRRGDVSGMLVLIRTGQVKIYRLLPNGRPITYFLFGPGDLFGFMPLMDGGPYPGNAEALEDVDALVLSREELIRAIHADPDLAVQLIAVLGRRLRAAMDTVEGLCTKGVQRRVAAALLDLALEEPPGARIRLPVSAQEFAGVVGVAPETVSRTLTCLEGNGILARQGRRQYRVLDLDGLRGAAMSSAGS